MAQPQPQQQQQPPPLNNPNQQVVRYGRSPLVLSKFQPPQSPLEKEDKSKKLRAPQWYIRDRTLDFIHDKIDSIRAQFNNRPLSDEAKYELRAWTNKLVQVESKALNPDINEEFINDFHDWLLGKSIFNKDKRLTPWGTRRLVGKEFDKYFTMFIEKKYEFDARLIKLKMTIPDNLNDAWIYYLYYVRNREIPFNLYLPEFGGFAQEHLATPENNRNMVYHGIQQDWITTDRRGINYNRDANIPYLFNSQPDEEVRPRNFGTGYLQVPNPNANQLFQYNPPNGYPPWIQFNWPRQLRPVIQQLRRQQRDGNVAQQAQVQQQNVQGGAPPNLPPGGGGPQPPRPPPPPPPPPAPPAQPQVQQVQQQIQQVQQQAQQQVQQIQQQLEQNQQQQQQIIQQLGAEVSNLRQQLASGQQQQQQQQESQRKLQEELQRVQQQQQQLQNDRNRILEESRNNETLLQQRLADSNQRIEQLNKQIDDLNNQIRNTEGRQRSQLEQHRAQLENLRKQTEENMKKLREAQTQNERLVDELRQSETERQQLISRLQELEKRSQDEGINLNRQLVESRNRFELQLNITNEEIVKLLRQLESEQARRQSLEEQNLLTQQQLREAQKFLEELQRQRQQQQLPEPPSQSPYPAPEIGDLPSQPPQVPQIEGPPPQVQLPPPQNYNQEIVQISNQLVQSSQNAIQQLNQFDNIINPNSQAVITPQLQQALELYNSQSQNPISDSSISGLLKKIYEQAQQNVQREENQLNALIQQQRQYPNDPQLAIAVNEQQKRVLETIHKSKASIEGAQKFQSGVLTIIQTFQQSTDQIRHFLENVNRSIVNLASQNQLPQELVNLLTEVSSRRGGGQDYIFESLVQFTYENLIDTKKAVDIIVKSLPHIFGNISVDNAQIRTNLIHLLQGLISGNLSSQRSISNPQIEHRLQLSNNALQAIGNLSNSWEQNQAILQQQAVHQQQVAQYWNNQQQSIQAADHLIQQLVSDIQQEEDVQDIESEQVVPPLPQAPEVFDFRGIRYDPTRQDFPELRREAIRRLYEDIQKFEEEEAKIQQLRPHEIDLTSEEIKGKLDRRELFTELIRHRGTFESEQQEIEVITQFNHFNRLLENILHARPDLDPRQTQEQRTSTRTRFLPKDLSSILGEFRDTLILSKFNTQQNDNEIYQGLLQKFNEIIKNRNHQEFLTGKLQSPILKDLFYFLQEARIRSDEQYDKQKLGVDKLRQLGLIEQQQDVKQDESYLNRSNILSSIDRLQFADSILLNLNNNQALEEVFQKSVNHLKAPLTKQKFENTIIRLHTLRALPGVPVNQALVDDQFLHSLRNVKPENYFAVLNEFFANTLGHFTNLQRESSQKVYQDLLEIIQNIKDLTNPIYDNIISAALGGTTGGLGKPTQVPRDEPEIKIRQEEDLPEAERTLITGRAR